MNSILLHVIQSGLSLAVLYIIFWLFLRKDTNFVMNRVYLLSSLILSLCIPFLSVSLSSNVYGTTSTYFIDAIFVTPSRINETISQGINMFQFINMIYLIGVLVAAIRFLFQLIQMGLLVSKYSVDTINGQKVVFMNNSYAPFSFFNLLFINKVYQNDNQLEKIISHEKVHINQLHTLDLIILEIITIIQWFNPFIWLYKKSLKTIHEFLADEGVLAQGIDRYDYQKLLIYHTIGNQLNGITNNFSQSLIKRRLFMMSKSKTNRFKLLKMVFITPLAIILAMFLSFTVTENVVAQEKNEIKQSSEISDVPVSEGEVFRVVEEMPKYPGGTKAFNSFIASNVKYPKEAIQKGTTGTVFVSFVVEKDGNVTNVKILRGIGDGCDVEALRVVSMLPNYEPGKEKGKPVRTEFNVPISFMLDSDKKNTKKEPSTTPEK